MRTEKVISGIKVYQGVKPGIHPTKKSNSYQKIGNFLKQVAKEGTFFEYPTKNYKSSRSASASLLITSRRVFGSGLRLITHVTPAKDKVQCWVVSVKRGKDSITAKGYSRIGIRYSNK